MRTSSVPLTRGLCGPRIGWAFLSVVAMVAFVAAPVQAGGGKFVVDVTVLEDTAESVVLHYAFGDFIETVVTIDGTDYTRIELGTESQMLNLGAPDLPNVCRSIILGHNAPVEVKIVSGDFYEIEDILLAPSKGNLYRDINPDDVDYAFGAAYEIDADYPGELAALSEPYTLRDFRGVVVRVNPFQYNAVSRTLRVYTDMTVEVVSNGEGGLSAEQPAVHGGKLVRAFHQLYSSHFENYGNGDRYTPLDFEDGDMLIICYDSWLANVQPLVNHKNSIGINTTIVGVSTIGNNSTSIKNYIQGVYDTSDLSFVLLVGDADEVEPPYASGGSSDPAYALLAGGDNYPDIFVGRFSAQNSSQVDTQVLRTIEYEELPATTQDWFKRGMGVASEEGDGIGDDGEADWVHMNNIRTDLLGYGYTVVDQIYDPGASSSAVTSGLNAGRGIVNYTGHGSTTAWSTTGFSTSHINSLTNDNMLPFIITVACVNGQFDGYTCFAEAWLRATNGSEPTGAIGVYASSINQSWAPPMCAQDEITDLLVAEAYWSLGGLCFAGSCQMMDEYGTGGNEMYDTWHIFGDPSLRVYGSSEPPTGLAVSGSNLAAAGGLGGPFTPDSTVYTLTNNDATPMDYEVTTAVTWVDITNASGTLPGLGTIDVTVSLNSQANSLGGGLHEGTIDFTNLTNHDGDVQRAVSIYVDAKTLQYDFPLDINPGWSTQGSWAFGPPTGGSGDHGNADPTSGHTGSNVYGYNLSGGYEDGMSERYLTTAAIDCTDLTDVELRFWRWLGVETAEYDHASVEVSNNGTNWTVLWANPGGYGNHTDDSSWSQQSFDISATADGEPTVYIRWVMGTSDGSWNFCGWNVDDIEFWAAGSATGCPNAGGSGYYCATDVYPNNGDGSWDFADDGDCIVDMGDLGELLANYGMTGGATREHGDVYPPGTGDGAVDMSDLGELLAQYGDDCN